MHQFHAGGLYNGLILLRDEETGTYWDHISGEGLHGPLAGYQLDVWSVNITTVANALETYPESQFVQGGVQKRSFFHWLGYLLFQRIFAGKMSAWKPKYPMGFKRTMTTVDGRLPEMTTGLGVFDGEVAKFYPMKQLKQGTIEDHVKGQTLTVGIDRSDGTPFAMWENGERPNQLLSRWYGFSLTFPNTEIYANEHP